MLRHRWPAWLTAIIALVGYPASSIFYYSMLLRSGALPVDRDSIGIPIFGDVIVTAAMTPIVLAITGLALRGYDGTARLLGWDERRPTRSVIFTVIFGLPAVLIGVALASDAFHSPPLPWWNFLADLEALPMIAWLVMIRAVLVSPRATIPPPREGTP